VNRARSRTRERDFLCYSPLVPPAVCDCYDAHPHIEAEVAV